MKKPLTEDRCLMTGLYKGCAVLAIVFCSLYGILFFFVFVRSALGVPAQSPTQMQSL